MKNLVFSFFLVFFFFFLSVSIFAQDQEPQMERERHQTIKISPTSFLANTFLIGYEHLVRRNNSIQIFGGVVAKERTTYSNGYDKVVGGIGELQFRAYLIEHDQKLKGLYASPYARIRYLKFEHKDPDFYIGIDKISYNLINYDAGVLLGYQFIIKKVLVLDLFAGGGIRISESNKPDDSYYYDSFDLLYQNYSGVVPKGGFKLGIAF